MKIGASRMHALYAMVLFTGLTCADTGWAGTEAQSEDAWREECETMYRNWAAAQGVPVFRGYHIDCVRAFMQYPDRALREAYVRRNQARRTTLDKTAVQPRGDILRTPKVISGPDLEAYYPQSMGIGETRRTVVRCKLDAQGRPQECIIVSSSGSQEADDATLRYVPNLTFETGPELSRVVTVPVTWKLEASDSETN